MKKLLKLLTEAEAEAKRLADLNPAHAGAQALRGKVASALEFTGTPAVKGIVEEAKPGNGE